MVEWLFGNLIRVCTKMLGSVLCLRLAGRNLDYLLLWERVTTVLYPLVVIGMCMLLSILDVFRFMVWPLFKSSAMIVKALDVCILHFFFILLQEHCCFLLCWGYLDASLLVMTAECGMTWLNLVENYVFVAVSPGITLLHYLLSSAQLMPYKTFLFSCVIVGICIY